MENKAISSAVVITCYNRVRSVSRAIDSVLRELPEAEIVIVDDCSTDNSVVVIEQKYSTLLNRGIIKLVKLDNNLGVSGAKNRGYLVAAADWVIFLDSDDYLLKGINKQVGEVLRTLSAIPIVFFRCINEEGKLVGSLLESDKFLSLETYLRHTSYGEALTCVNRKLMGDKFMYPTELRGYEGLGCLDAIHEFGPAYLSNVVARVYSTDSEDRLSSAKGYLKRLNKIADGHKKVLAKYGRYMSFTDRLRLFIKFIAYRMLSILKVIA